MNFENENENKSEMINYALQLSKSNQFDLAIDILKKIYSYYPKDYQTLYNIAKLYLEKKDYDTSIKYYKYLLTLNPTNVQAKFDLSHIYLINRDLKNGLELYECRIDFKQYIEMLPSKYPKRIKDLKNKKVFIYWEQGFGDTINFIRYIKYLKKFTSNIHILIQKPLINLVKYNLNKVTVIEDDSYLTTKYDYVFSLLSIPYLIKLRSFKPLKKYLKVNTKDIKKYKKLNNIESININIGLCWQGEYKNSRDKYRSFEIVEFLSQLKKSKIKMFKKIKFYSLQKDVRVQNNKIIDLGKDFNNFYDTAVAIKSLDLIITVDTAVCHLSASLGKKTFLLLPFYPDWRWGENIDKSDLYKSIRYFKQVDKDSWDIPFQLIAEKLKKYQ